jgi:hypothetical protein
MVKIGDTCSIYGSDENRTEDFSCKNQNGNVR